MVLRIRKKQAALFADGGTVKHFRGDHECVGLVAAKLLAWHREKAGSIEAARDVIKNELASGVMPCGRFGRNAAWPRLAVLTCNLLTALKRLALPPELLTARPKRLRLLIFYTSEYLRKTVHHARHLWLRLVRGWNRFGNWRHALSLLPLPAR